MKTETFLQNYPFGKKREETFFDVLGVTTRETAICQCLAYFLDPANAPGLAEILLKKFLPAETFENGVNVATEEKTSFGSQKDKRIDIVITTENAVAAIEAKIYNAVGNPFEIYKEHIEKKYDEKDPKYWLLTLRKEENRGDFKAMTFEALFGDIIDSLDSYESLSEKSKKYFKELLINMENLKNNDSPIDEVTLTYIKSHKLAAKRISNELNKLSTHLKNRIEEVYKKVDEELKDKVFRKVQSFPMQDEIGYVIESKLELDAKDHDGKPKNITLKFRRSTTHWVLWVWDIKEPQAFKRKIEALDTSIKAADNKNAENPLKNIEIQKDPGANHNYAIIYSKAIEPNDKSTVIDDIALICKKLVKISV